MSRELTEEQKKFIEAGTYYGKCGCGWLKTDYPFMNCLDCGYIGCSSEEDIELARKLGYLIDWKINPPEGVPISEIQDRTTHFEDEDYDDDFYDEEKCFDIMDDLDY